MRRERIRREKHAQRADSPGEREPHPDPLGARPFAAERAMREIQTLLAGQKFDSIDEINERLAELTAGGRLTELAQSWNRDDPKWRAQELAYDALETDDYVEALRLIDEALKLDPDCTDAQRLMVSILPMQPDNRLALMREVVDKAERNLGPSFFDKHKGHFWSEIATRPYMRAKQHLAELLIETDKLDEAIATLERVLELNPHDNQGVRYSLLALYLATGNLGSAGRVLAHHSQEERHSGIFAWARVLERWLAGKVREADTALVRARKVNRFVEAYISGARPFPQSAPSYYRPGDDSEAQVCAAEFRVAWTRYPDFGTWIGTHR
ncbi:MAG TPA: tetratricopeptide repeat protein [Bryobacteraceae bacterium]|nr:tetratricopeptide repeat protein [Bryobacteraceae bacterium]